MFENSGGKIKGLAVLNFILDSLFCLIFGIVFITQELVGLGFVLMSLGVFVSYVISVVIYAFGELVENSDTVVRQNTKLIKKIDAMAAEKAEKNVQTSVPSAEKKETPKAPSTDKTQSVKPIPSGDQGKVKCPSCGCVQLASRTSCWSCGVKFGTDGNNADEENAKSAVKLYDKKGKTDAPYWCGKCGKDGPYEGNNCPDCGSSLKIYNTK